MDNHSKRVEAKYFKRKLVKRNEQIKAERLSDKTKRTPKESSNSNLPQKKLLQNDNLTNDSKKGNDDVPNGIFSEEFETEEKEEGQLDEFGSCEGMGYSKNFESGGESGMQVESLGEEKGDESGGNVIETKQEWNQTIQEDEEFQNSCGSCIFIDYSYLNQEKLLDDEDMQEMKQLMENCCKSVREFFGMEKWCGKSEF